MFLKIYGVSHKSVRWKKKTTNNLEIIPDDCETQIAKEKRKGDIELIQEFNEYKKEKRKTIINKGIKNLKIIILIFIFIFYFFEIVVTIYKL